MTNGNKLSAAELYPSTDGPPSLGPVTPANDNRRPRRVAIYARFSALSPTGSNFESSAHQVAVCREYAASEGMEVADVYIDDALSGVPVVSRPSFLRMIRDSERGHFEVVLVLGMSRLGRDAGTVIPILAKLFDAGMLFYVVGHGKVEKDTALTMIVHAEGSARYSRTATRVAKQQRARKGVWLSIAPFGYRKHPDEVGKLVKHEEEAAEIVRIVDRIIEGASSLQICQDLNERGVKRRGNGIWTPGVLVGKPDRPGVCRNGLIVGQAVYGRRTSRIDPETGRTVYTPVPAEKWIVAEVPELAIIDMPRFQELQSVLDRRATGPKKGRGPRPLLSGKLRCAGCGAMMISKGGGDGIGFGVRMRCRVAYHHGACDMNQTINRGPVQDAVLDRIQAMVSSGSLEREMAEEYVRQRELRQEVHGADLREVKGKLAKTEALIAKLVDLALDDRLPRSIVGEKMKTLESQRDEFRAEVRRLEYATADLIDEIASLDRVRDGLADIRRVMEEGKRGADMGTEVADAIRALIDDIRVTPTPDGYWVQVTGLAGFETLVPVRPRGRPKKGTIDDCMTIDDRTDFEEEWGLRPSGTR